MVSAVTSNTPAATSTSQDASSLAGNYTMFLNLLTSQIKNQDPLSPMDTTAWTNQLVQYSSVEQQLKANQFLEKIAAGNGTSDMNAAVSYIGKTVSAATDTAALKDGAAKWDYTLGGTADNVKLSILDSTGKTVWSEQASGDDLAKGKHSLEWDGKNSAGNTLADGNYILQVTATNAGAAVAADTSVSGVVTSAENTGTSVVLNVGNTSVPITSITSVS